MLIGYTCKLTQTSTGKGKGGRGGDDLLEVTPIVRMGRRVELSECFTNLRSTLIEVFTQTHNHLQGSQRTAPNTENSQ